MACSRAKGWEIYLLGFKMSFVHIWLCWGFISAQALLGFVSRGCLPVAVRGLLSLRCGLPFVVERGSRGLRSQKLGLQDLEHRLSSYGTRALALPRHGIFRTRTELVSPAGDRRIIGRWILYH